MPPSSASAPSPPAWSKARSPACRRRCCCRSAWSVGGACCAVLSASIAYPILRLRGTFFAIAMLGVSHVCAEVTNNIDFFQGSLGLNFPPIAPASMDPAIFFY